MRKRIIFSLLGVSPVVLMGFSTGPPIKRTGLLADGGLNCTACHRTFAPANSDPRGNVRIDAASYVPGVKQTIRVTVFHPEAQRWGFQLTARMVNDETKPAGTFAPGPEVKIMCGAPGAETATNLGTAGPCDATQLQFAEHFDAPRSSVGAGHTFTIDWTPPDTNVGDIIFYAAGNATDGSASNAGDRVFTTVRRISAPCGLTAKPTITSAVNGASFGAPWSSGAMMSIFGANFGAAGQKRMVTQGDIVSRAFPSSLGCLAVTINGQNAPMAYVQPDQINLQAPSLTGVGPATVVVIANPGAANELRSEPFNLTTQQAFSPALFTFDGKSVAAVTPDGSRYIANSSLIPGASPARPGEIVSLFGTGLGATNPVVVPGEVASDIANVTTQVTVSIGGTALAPADILYVGVSPQSISGLIQLNVRLPATLADGDLPVIISAGGVTSAAGTMIPVRR